jgi:hypothetical protein
MKTLTIAYKKTEDSDIAFAKVTKTIGFATSVLASGYIQVTPESNVGDTITLPEDTKVSTRTSTTEDGKTFIWLILD